MGYIFPKNISLKIDFVLSKQHRPRSSGSSLFAIVPFWGFPVLKGLILAILGRISVVC